MKIPNMAAIFGNVAVDRRLKLNARQTILDTLSPEVHAITCP
jgi:hypothetical protein